MAYTVCIPYDILCGLLFIQYVLSTVKKKAMLCQQHGQGEGAYTSEAKKSGVGFHVFQLVSRFEFLCISFTFHVPTLTSPFFVSKILNPLYMMQVFARID